jgi:hypothetical protein
VPVVRGSPDPALNSTDGLPSNGLPEFYKTFGRAIGGVGRPTPNRYLTGIVLNEWRIQKRAWESVIPTHAAPFLHSLGFTRRIRRCGLGTKGKMGDVQREIIAGC